MTISFKTRSGIKISGLVYEDYGHALLIEVLNSNRKNLCGRKMLFPKNDMGPLNGERVS
jgi:hypothetical protein